jgi:hypothetical protein
MWGLALNFVQNFASGFLFGARTRWVIDQG